MRKGRLHVPLVKLSRDECKWFPKTPSVTPTAGTISRIAEMVLKGIHIVHKNAALSVYMRLVP